VNRFIGSSLVVTTISSYTLKITVVISHVTSHTKSSNSSSGHTAVLSEVNSKVKVTLRLTVGQSVSLCFEPHLGLMTRYLLLFENYGLVFVRRPL
jgi:hypothetical protein